MNYEELLETRDVRKTTRVRLPYGYFYKRLIDGKYSNFVEFHDEIADDITFSSSVKAEYQALEDIQLKQQLQFTPNEGEDGIYAIAVEVGNYVTIEQQLNENPAMVAKRDFVNAIFRELFEITAELNAHDIYHVCFAPSNILARKNDCSVRLLLHGSFYRRVDPEILYDGVEMFVAPEVFAGQPITAAADVYSLGRFIDWIYRSSGLPEELKSVVKKATSQDSSRRYASVEAFRQAVNNSRLRHNVAIYSLSTLAIALCIIGLFFYLVPNREPMEFVKPAKEPFPEDMFEDNKDDYSSFGADIDSATIAGIVMPENMAEAAFREQFITAAEVVISKVYNSETMNEGQAAFAAKTKQMTEELANKQAELAGLTNLSFDRAQIIAAEIVDTIARKRMEAMENMKPSPDGKRPLGSTVSRNPDNHKTR